MTRRIGIVITNRTGSSRIPSKPMAEIADRRALDIQLGFLKRAGLPIVAALPAGSDDDALARCYQGSLIDVVRGHDKSPLHRLAMAAEKYQFDDVIRVTSDDLFIDAEVLAHQLSEHLRRAADYTYCTSAPSGTTAEVVSRETLEKAVNLSGSRDVEFVSYAVRNAAVKIHPHSPHVQYRYQYRLTLDWPEDLVALRVIGNAMFSSFGWDFDLVDLIHFMRMRRNYYIQQINRTPSVSIYTANMNQSRYILEAMESVVHQDGAWEYLVYDDGSTDDSLAVISRWHTALPDDIRARVQVYANEKNIGLPATCNRALSRTRGRYLLRLDADDIMLPGAVEKLVGTMNTLGDAAALFCGYQRVKEDGKAVISVQPDNIEEHPGMCLLLARAAHDVRYREGLEHYEGREFMKRFKERYRVAHTPEILWNYREHQGSKSSVQTPERIAIAKELAGEKP